MVIVGYVMGSGKLIALASVATATPHHCDRGLRHGMSGGVRVGYVMV